MADLRIQYLLNKWSSNAISAEEEQELFAWIMQHDDIEEVHEHVLRLAEQHKNSDVLPSVDYDVLFNKILQQRQTDKPAVKRAQVKMVWLKYAAAACIAALIVIGVNKSIVSNKIQKTATATIAKTDIQPGGNKATLTLNNGKIISLDSIHGNIAQSSQQQIINNNGVINYSGNSDVVEYNTITTPRGGMYNVQLADGTQVWLNAASSITFPTAFNGNERNVSITGEAYFEVAHDKTKPFHVKVNDVMVEVLGTHFNINSYADEAGIKTTLLQGSVRITENNQQIIIKPGEQAIVNPDNPSIQKIQVHTIADMDEVMAWKNGSFIFNDAPLPEAMKQIARWYDVDVVYQQNIPDIKIGGEMKRDLTLSQLLNGLGKIGVHFTIEGKKLIVLPN